MLLSKNDALAVSLWAALYVFAIAGAIFHRLRAGGSLRGLAERKFEEIPALRWLLQSVAAIAVVAVVFVCGEGLVSGRMSGGTLRGTALPAWISYALLLFAGAIGCVAMVGWFRRQEESRATMDVGRLVVKREISREELAAIGSAGATRSSGRSSKSGWDEWRAVGFAGLGLIAIAVVRWAVGVWPEASIVAVAAMMRAGSWSVRELAAAVPSVILTAVVVPAAISAGVLTTEVAGGPTLDRSRRLVLEFGLVSILALWAAVLALDARCKSAGAVAVAIFGVGLVVLSLREELEEHRVQALRKARQLREAIVQGFPACEDELAHISGTGLLKPLTIAGVRARIEDGLEQLESRSRLVPRLLGRLMTITDVAAVPCAAVALRFLVIRRWAVLVNPTPTTDMHRRPVVDVWNQHDFPIAPPVRYEAVDDRRAALPPDFDVIKACSDCGGTGWVWREESHSDLEPWTNADGETEWRTVTNWRRERHTCSACSGTGSLRYTQVIVTSFKTYQPTVRSDPWLPACSVLDGTSELDVLRRPFIEAFNPTLALDSGAQLSSSVAVRLRDLAVRVIARHAQDAKLVAQHYGGRVYRSELALFLSNAVRIRFKGMPGGIAWFFGAAPRGHFGRIPLSWSTVVAMAVLPLLAAYGLAEGCSLMEALLHVLTGR